MLFRKQIILIPLSVLWLASCDMLRIGEETQDLSQPSGDFSGIPTQGACKPGPTKESKERSAATYREEVNAPFYVEKIRGFIDTDKDKKNGLPYQFRLNLETCLKDTRKVDSSIPFTSFAIRYNTFENGKLIKKTITRPTDGKGCLSWPEVYPYKYVAQPFWVNLWREIVREEKGYYAGKVNIPTAVNFWLKDTENFQKEEKIRDLRPPHYRNDEMFNNYPVVEKGLACLTDKKHQQKLHLWAPNITIQFNQNLQKSSDQQNKTSDFKNETDAEKESLIKSFQRSCKEGKKDENCFYRVLNMELTIPLELKLRDIHGSPKTERINGGMYDVTAQLVGEYPPGTGNYYRIHKEELPKKKVTMSSRGTKYLSTNFELQIPYINTNANHKLTLRIEATDSNLPFKIFEGVYTIQKPGAGAPVTRFTMDSSLDGRYSGSLDDPNEINIIEEMGIEYIYYHAEQEAEKQRKEWLEKTKEDKETLKITKNKLLKKLEEQLSLVQKFLYLPTPENLLRTALDKQIKSLVERITQKDPNIIKQLIDKITQDNPDIPLIIDEIVQKNPEIIGLADKIVQEKPNITSLIDKIGQTEATIEKLNKAESHLPTDEEITNTMLKNLGFKPIHMSVSIETVRFANTKPYETAVERQVEYVGKACLKDIFTENLEGTNFRVIRENLKLHEITGNLETIENEEGKRYKEIFKKEKTDERPWPWERELLSTNQFNCISWKDTIGHKNFDRQIYFPRRMHFISKELKLYGKALIAISPWHNQFQFYQDITELGENSIRTDAKEVEYPRLVIPQFKSVNFFPSSIIDKFLNLKMKYNLRFLFQPIITRPDSLAWGKLPRSREMIRDGFYLLRILIVRNPQETGSSKTTETEAQNKKRKKILFNSATQLQLNDLKYLSHIDTVVKVEANFVNPYIPIEFTSEQLIYLASRNLVIIHMVPADPEKYKEAMLEGKEEKDRWFPYEDHDLITFPYAGPMNVQNWTNWNILQEGCNRDEEGKIIDCLRTDDIIAQSEEGSKYMLFRLDGLVNRSIANDANEYIHGAKRGLSPSATPVAKATEQIVQSEESFEGKNNDKFRIYNAIGGSDACKNRLAEVELQNRARTSDGNSTDEFDGQLPRNRFSEPDGSIGACEPDDQECLKCGNDLNCISITNQIRESKLFGRLDCGDLGYYDSETEKCVTIDGTETAKLTGLGTEGCVDETVIPTLLEERNRTADLSLASDSEENENPDIDTLLENFARANALKLLDLSDQTIKEKFLADTKRQSDEIDRYASQVINKKNLVFTTFSAIKELVEGLYSFEERKEFLILWNEIDKICSEKYISHLNEVRESTVLLKRIRKLPWNEFYQSCAIATLRDHLREEIKTINTGQITLDNPTDPDKAMRNKKEKLKRLFTYLENEEDLPKKLVQLTPQEILEDDLEYIIDNWHKMEDEDLILKRSFSHSLCGFWFNSYLKDYLKEEQMLTSFTNSIRKLDYRLVLDSDLFQSESVQRDAVKLLQELYAMIPSDEEVKECSESYYSCVTRDYCRTDRKATYTNKRICENRITVMEQDKSCEEFILRKCHENEENPLCEKKESRTVNEEQCRKKVQSYCEMNPKNSSCSQYKDRCFANYLACSKDLKNFNLSKEEFLNHFQEKKELIFGHPSSPPLGSHTYISHPLKTCIKNPYEFFSFSNKMIVGGISHVRFKEGLMQHFSLNGSFSVGSYMNWTADRGTSMGLRGGLKFPLLSDWFGLGGDVSIGIGSNESNSDRRALDKRMANSVFLVSSEAVFEIDVTHFRKCLVIKPRVNSLNVKYDEEGLPQPYKENNVWPESFFNKPFKKMALARPGLIICNPPKEKGPTEEPQTIEERFYYVSQSNVRTDTAHIINLYDIRNRPFVTLLRGQGEFLKYFNLTRQTTETQNKQTRDIPSANEVPVNMFLHYPHPVEDLADYSLSLRVFGDTGFHQGVYTYPAPQDRLNALFPRTKETSPGQETFNWVRDNLNSFQIPVQPSRNIPVQ